MKPPETPESKVETPETITNEIPQNVIQMPEIKGNETPKRYNTALTDTMIIEAIEACGGFISQAAVKLQCGSSTIYAHMAKNQKIRDKIHEIRERYVDMVESKLLKLCNEEEIAAIIFFLKCQGKRRGYVERQEVDANIRSEVTFNLITAMPKPKRNRQLIEGEIESSEANTDE